MGIDEKTRIGIANTILQQFGGVGRFKIMTGAKDFSVLDNGVQFRIPLKKARINKVVIKLNSNDLYDLEFLHVKKDFSYVVKNYARDIPWDSLQKVFTQATGLETHL